MFALDIDGALKIIGIYSACPTCAATGKLAAGGACTLCNGSGWRKKIGAWKSKEGINFTKPGAVLEAKKLAPPERPEHRALYDSV